MEKDADRDLHKQANWADEAETNNPNKGATRPLRGAAKQSHERKLELDALLDCNEECGSCPAQAACRADANRRSFAFESWNAREGSSLRGIGHGLVHSGAGLLLMGVGAGRLALTGAKAVTRGCINVFEWSYRKLQKREGK